MVFIKMVRAKSWNFDLILIFLVHPKCKWIKKLYDILKGNCDVMRRNWKLVDFPQLWSNHKEGLLPSGLSSLVYRVNNYWRCYVMLWPTYFVASFSFLDLTQTHGHPHYYIESAQWADSMKITQDILFGWQFCFFVGFWIQFGSRKTFFGLTLKKIFFQSNI